MLYNIYSIQAKFSKLHIPIYVALILFVLERSLRTPYKYLGGYLWFLIPVLLIDYIGYKTSFFKLSKFVYIFRYIQLFIFSIMFTTIEYNYIVAISLVLYFLAYMEFIALYDYSDNYYRIISSLVGICPATFSISYSVYIRGEINGILFIQIGIITSITAIITYRSCLYDNYKSIFEEKIFSQNRLLSSVNETNEELKNHQEKLKRANEELGYRKVMLEAANNRINNSNIQIGIQNKIMKYISSSLEIDKLMALITESLYQELELDVCAITLNPNSINNKNVLYRIHTSYNREYESFLGHQIESGCFNEYVKNNQTYVDNKVIVNNYSFIKTLQIGSLLITPLIKDNVQIGFIFVGSSKYDAFAENNEFYEVIVSQILIALDNANIYSKMQEMAIRDELTGVYNRGHLSKLLGEYITEAIINETPISVALIDIDKFKSINDTYGHLFGDIIIKTVAKLSDEMATRNQGIIGRYGGEEFVLVFPEKGLDEVLPIIEGVRESIKAYQIIHYGEVIQINVSIGVTCYPNTCKNPHDLLNRADWSMYYSKENGRDRITIDSDEIRERVFMK